MRRHEPDGGHEGAPQDADGIRLLLFFSHGMTLAEWDASGLLDREIAYYRALSERLGPITLLTYDKNRQAIASLAGRLGALSVLRNDIGVHYRLFGLLAPLRHLRTIRRADILKTNQFSGAWTAVLAKLLTGKPLVVRGGFVRSRNLERSGQTTGTRRWLAGALERLAVRNADLVFVATPDDRRYLVERHGLDQVRVIVVPNPIDVDTFAPDPEAAEKRGLVLTVGRLSQEKNTGAIINAVGRIRDAELAIIGVGPEEARLRKMAANAPVKFLGRVPNRQVPDYLRCAQVFVMASQYEGSPKALLEAMSCGRAVAAVDAPGVREVIYPDVTGLLAERGSAPLAQAIERLLQDDALRARLGKAARQYVVERHSQQSVASREAALLRSLVDAGAKR